MTFSCFAAGSGRLSAAAQRQFDDEFFTGVKKTFEGVNRTFFQVPKNPKNYGPLKETLGVPERGKLSKSCSWCRTF